MKYIILFTGLLLAYYSLSAQQLVPSAEIISQPVVIEDDDWRFEGTENLMFVPENRNKADSRKIALHFFRFPAREKSTLAPVVFLGAGPGEPYAVEVFYDGSRAEAWRYELNFVNQKRDVLLINQRGNSDSPGLPPREFIYRWKNGGKLDQPLDLALMNRNRREAYAQHINAYTDKGMDLAGYDIFHFVDDIEAVRKQLGYKKIALIGNSFASQWGLGYMQRYPERVDRALFSGVEPLDHNYDDPEGIWKVFETIDTYARADEAIAQYLPEGGLLEAFTAVIERLEKTPQYARLTIDGEEMDVAVGADDLRYCLTYPRVRSYHAEIESWPKYIMELYQGEYSSLASISQGRIYNSTSRMINPLFNNSLGISPEREAILNSRPSRRWLGEINSHYVSTRDICPAPKVPAEFRQHKSHDIPTLLIQGDMDMSTPYENATFLMEYLENGHLITVKRGFHNAKRALIFADSTLMNQIYEFMNMDFGETDFQTFKSSLPDTYEMPPFEFWPIEGETLFERYRRERKR
ncbi:MAG: alpha/beta fold hydrolase [Bacteroidota bacterium]